MRFDVREERLFLDEAALESLRGWLEAPDDQATEELVTAGMLPDATLHPALVPLAEAMASQVCHLTLTVSGSRAVTTHRLWLTPQLLVTAAWSREDRWEILTTTSPFVAAALARLARLGVRPRLPGEPVAADIDAVTDLFAPTGPDRQRAAGYLARTAPPAWEAWSSALRDDLWRAWRLDAEWIDPDGDQVARQLAVIDTSGGAVEIDWPTPAPQLSPTTPARLWELFVAILPADHELYPGPVPA